MKMSKKMYEISEKMQELHKEAEAFQNSGDTEKTLEKLSEFDELKKQYETEKRLLESKQFFDPSEGEPKTVPGTTAKADSQSDGFIKAVKSKFRDESLTKALMTEGTGASAGYLVPSDIQTKINEYKTNRFSFEKYIGVETVTTNSGSRVYRQNGTSSPFTKVAEGGRLQIIGAPQYTTISYTIGDFGGIIPVTNDLLEDSPENIRAELTKHFAMCREDTINAQVLTLVGAQNATAIAGLDDIRTQLIVGLGGAYTPTSAVYTNDDGYAYLVNLKDKDDRDYFFYNPAQPGQLALNIGGMIIPFVHVPNAVMASTSANNHVTMPFILGDLKTAFKMFDRKSMTIKASDQGIVEYQVEEEGQMVTKFYNAFTDNLTLFRAFMRADFKTIDNAAFKNCTLTL